MLSNQELVERIRSLARKKGTSLTKIEAAIPGLSNGRIGKWATAKKSPPYGLLLAIADFLEVPISAITDSLTPEQQKTPTSEEVSDSIKVAQVKAIIRTLRSDDSLAEIYNAAMEQQVRVRMEKEEEE